MLMFILRYCPTNGSVLESGVSACWWFFGRSGRRLCHADWVMYCSCVRHYAHLSVKSISYLWV